MHCGNPFDLRGDASRNLQEQAMLFEMSCKKLNPDIDRSITLEKYTEIWLQKPALRIRSFLCGRNGAL